MRRGDQWLDTGTMSHVCETEEDLIEAAARDAEHADADLADMVAYMNAEEEFKMGLIYLERAYACFKSASAAGHLGAIHYMESRQKGVGVTDLNS